ncbi:SDR family NAD(P)-dependent oxidoreductase [Actinocrispum wychmicini]|uniref:NAD(P)-dependent dehydrogenase (Short-subunit alcohol dehydrogenase family) n=1 Tax=Actinocrispum wychmicini TaxID=1213861 RepID=A0A4R2JBW5_9PSEU|nr:SDR family oxidoreductase [Actinocrispum wychmicini]TCO55887.1 NAD(P)-dependent dehydrogenase (short-subunit alcohol dehydrogenase family) [Actinocrispum wychmicini]
MNEFEGRSAVVTGGSLGIGLAVVRRLAGAGAQVVFGGHEELAVRQAEQDLRRDGLTVRGITGDLSHTATAEELVNAAVEDHGGLDVVVNSAGIQAYGTVEQTSDAEWDRVLAVNLRSVFTVCRAAIPRLRERGGGAIVNVSSVQAVQSQSRVAVYATSKAAIAALTRSIAVDHAVDGIRVTAVLPGSVDTPMLRHSAELMRGNRSVDDVLDDWGHMHPMGRVATSAEVAELVAFLAGPRAGFITGSCHVVDGGLLARLGVALPAREEP